MAKHSMSSVTMMPLTAIVGALGLALVGNSGPAHAESKSAKAVSPETTQENRARESAERLRSDVERMVAFGTRHTLSSQSDPKRGIGAAIDWGAESFRAIGRACGGCLTVEIPVSTVTGRRVPKPTTLRNAIAIQRGTERPDEVVIIQGHIDSRASDVMDATSDAPGANDNASGSALVLEAARQLSQKRYPTTIVYALLSGEEQGLLGGEELAKLAKQRAWQVKAVLNNDIVGGSRGSDGYSDDMHVRVFSEGPRADSDDEIRAQARRFGGENDSPSRNLSRYISGFGSDGLSVRQIWRADRMGRGGDHLPFLNYGFPGVRFSVAVEDYEHQHQDVRREDSVKYGDTPDEMDFPYLAKVTALNVAVADRLARAPMPPAPQVDAAVKTYSDLTWHSVPGAAKYNVYMRRTNDSDWPDAPAKATGETALRLEGVRGDDWIFGVSAITADGAESPIASAVPGGAFAPIPASMSD